MAWKAHIKNDYYLTYEGEMSGSKKHGKGKLTWHDSLYGEADYILDQ